MHLALPTQCACYKTQTLAFPRLPSLHDRHWIAQIALSTYACPVHPLLRWLHIGQSVPGMREAWGKGSSPGLPGSVPQRRIRLQSVCSLACHCNCPGNQDTTDLQLLGSMILWSQVLNVACWQERDFAHGLRMPFQVPDNRMLMSGTSRRKYHSTWSLEARRS